MIMYEFIGICDYMLIYAYVSLLSPFFLLNNLKEITDYNFNKDFK